MKTEKMGLIVIENTAKFRYKNQTPPCTITQQNISPVSSINNPSKDFDSIEKFNLVDIITALIKKEKKMALKKLSNDIYEMNPYIAETYSTLKQEIQLVLKSSGYFEQKIRYRDWSIKESKVEHITPRLTVGAAPPYHLPRLFRLTCHHHLSQEDIAPSLTLWSHRRINNPLLK